MASLRIPLTRSVRRLFFLGLLMNLFTSVSSSMMLPNTFTETDPCLTCRKISEKFVESYKKTARSNFGGGNTDWEEKKLKGYAKSETRLIEIMEDSCTKSDGQCSSFLEKYEDTIEEWYQATSPASIDQFYSWLCFDTAKVCCPEGTFGKNCRRCQHGDNGRVCSGNGNCDGDGKRSGNGRCVCETKYAGTNCSRCAEGYSKSIGADNKVVCSDIDECRANLLLSPCLLYQCNNTEGSYECYGEPFYHQLPKVSSLVVIILTAVFLMYKDYYGLASIVCTMGSVLLVLYAKHLL